MHENGFAVYDERGNMVKGPFRKEHDANSWLAANPLWDVYDEEEECVAEGFRSRREGLEAAKRLGVSIVELRTRPLSYFDVLPYYAHLDPSKTKPEQHAINEGRERFDDTDAPDSSGLPSRRAQKARKVRRTKTMRGSARTDSPLLLICTRCDRSYLPEVEAAQAERAGGGHRKGRCQDCRRRPTRKKVDLVEVVSRVMRGLPPDARGTTRS